MSFAGSSMLFMPPEPPFELRGDSTVVLGRSRSCELRLANGEASRRHAEICATEDGFLLRAFNAVTLATSQQRQNKRAQ